MAHIIKCGPSGSSYSSLCLHGEGVYLHKMKYCWLESSHMYCMTKRFISYSRDEIYQHICSWALFSNNYSAALTLIREKNFTENPWPVVLEWCDNTSVSRSHGCMKLNIGRALCILFCGLLINSRLGINYKWLWMHGNVVVDEISWPKQQVPHR